MIQPLSLLLVDDDPADVELMKEALARASFDCTVEDVGTADEAYFVLARRLSEDQGLPDLILLDLSLPGESGLEMLGKLQSVPELSKMKVVVLSGSSDSEDMSQARKLGATWYFVKQTKPQDLDYLVKELLRIHQG